MGTFKEHNNPFVVKTPEGMSAADTVSLFVDVFTDFPKVKEPGHVFLHGPRGSGKSMMFRYLQPDCKCIVHQCAVRDLPFFSIYVPVKNTDLKLTELGRLDGQHASTLINEHFMVMHVAETTFAALAKLDVGADSRYADEAKRFLIDVLCPWLQDFGWQGALDPVAEARPVRDYFEQMARLCKRVYQQLTAYVKKLAFPRGPVPYDGPLCGYVDFLFPVLCELRKLSFMPDTPIYLLFDDADNLSLTQTRVLNTWVSTRTSSDISIKVSTQLRYKTLRTVTGLTISAPHDFSEVNISTVYTAPRKGKYRSRIYDIVKKRLELARIEVRPEGFFPRDETQEAEIKAIAQHLRDEWQETGRGYRPGDDAYRYARPNYMRQLAGASKSTPSYSYAGFDQLVHVSSGIIRFFLDPACQMYSEAQAQMADEQAVAIPPHLQDQQIREYSDNFLFREFEELLADESDETPPADDVTRLRNLVQALGGTFRLILVSDRSERRVFSFAFSDAPDDDTLRILKLGTQLGYFHLSAIGNKDGTGRTPLYVLSRRLAPHFNLDPTSFAGYLFVTSDAVRQALANPNRLLRRVKSQGVDQVFEPSQQELFGGELG